MLPSGFTFKWYDQLWSDPRFLKAFGQSLLVCVAALVLSVVLILPLLFVVHYHFPKLDALMNILILLSGMSFARFNLSNDSIVGLRKSILNLALHILVPCLIIILLT